MFKMTWAKPAGKNSTHDGEEPGSGTQALALVVLFGSILYMFMGIGGMRCARSPTRSSSRVASL